MRKPKEKYLSEKQKKIVKAIEIKDKVLFEVTRLDIHHDILSVSGEIASKFYDKMKNWRNDLQYRFTRRQQHPSCRHVVAEWYTVYQDPVQSQLGFCHHPSDLVDLWQVIQWSNVICIFSKEDSRARALSGLEYVNHQKYFKFIIQYITTPRMISKSWVFVTGCGFGFIATLS